MRKKTNQSGPLVYLIHLESKFGRTQHYIGCTINLEGRMWHHKNGSGSTYLAAANRAGINYTVVRTWDASYEFEQRMKRRKCAPDYCPVCRANKKLLNQSPTPSTSHSNAAYQ